MICAATASLRANNAIAGGSFNCIVKYAHDSFIGGGIFNRICGEGTGAANPTSKATKNNAIIGGYSNIICDKNGNAERNVIIGGGANNMIFCETTAPAWRLSKHNTIIGGNQNIIRSGNCNVQNSSINGGKINKICGMPNSFIGGGMCNLISGSDSNIESSQAIVGGKCHTILGNSTHNFIGGGLGNNITGSIARSAIIGGFRNTIKLTSTQGVILGGCNNIICDNQFGAIINGQNNLISAAHNNSAIIAASNRTSTQADTLFTNNICAFGTLTKSSGTFLIDHPNPEKESTHNLVHSFVESPTAGDNIYRFSVTTVNNEAEIILPEYYRYLNENSQLWVSADGHFGKAFGIVNISATKIKISSNSDGIYNVMLVGTRKDKAATSAWKGVVLEKTKEEKINFKNSL